MENPRFIGDLYTCYTNQLNRRQQLQCPGWFDEDAALALVGIISIPVVYGIIGLAVFSSAYSMYGGLGQMSSKNSFPLYLECSKKSLQTFNEHLKSPTSLSTTTLSLPIQCHLVYGNALNVL